MYNPQLESYLNSILNLTLDEEDKETLFKFFAENLLEDKNNTEYIERPPIGPHNWDEKKPRFDQGGDFETSGMTNLNKAIADFFYDAKTVVNIGAGTGMLEWYAQRDDIQFLASEMDDGAREWAIKNRSKENIKYCKLSMKEILEKYPPFDVAFLIDVIEHIDDYFAFLQEFTKLSNRAVITTPNKFHDYRRFTVSPPDYYQHVREWTAGELYWILKIFYKNVKLYAMEDWHDTKLLEIGTTSHRIPVIAVCEGVISR